MRLFLALVTLPVFASAPLHRVLDLAEKESATVMVGGRNVLVTLQSVKESTDPVTLAVREATVSVTIGKRGVTLGCGNYELPRRVGGVRIDCTVTRGYKANSTEDHWKLRKDARIRIWPATGPLMPAGEFGFPLEQRWLATHTQMSNEPTYVDRGERTSRRKIYYHSGLDQGGAEGMAVVVSATDGQVVSLGDAVMPEHAKSPAAKRYDVIYLLDDRGWYYRYSHLYSFEPGLQLGQRVRKGDQLGLLGKEGGSGGWSHLHFEIKAKQPSGEYGTEEGFAFLWEAAVEGQKLDLVAMARPHRIAVVGEPVPLDGSRSWSRSGKIASYEWTLTNGEKTRGARIQRTYAKPGTYSEILKATDAKGRVSYDFVTVNVLDPKSPQLDPITLHLAFHPTQNVRAGQPVTFKGRTFGTTHGEEAWDFGDGSATVKSRSDGNVKSLAKDGYAILQHTYAKPGDYIVRVERTSDLGITAVAHLWVRVE